MNEIDRVKNNVDRFLEKVAGENKPFQQFLKSPDFKAYKSTIQSGIKSQMLWAAKMIREMDATLLPDSMEPLTTEQLDTVAQWIRKNLPIATDYISEASMVLNLKAAFEWGVKAQYERWGIITKADIQLDFELTNTYYIAQLKSMVSYLLNRSSIDETTTEQIIKIIRDGKLDSLTNEEVAAIISDNVESITDARAYTIARTEVAQAMSAGQLASMQENGVPTKAWIPAGAHTCAICEGNADDGMIGIDETFNSGDNIPPAHPNCECYLEAGEINLDTIDIWGGE